MIVDRPCQALGFTETGEDPLEFSEGRQCRAKVKAKIDRRLQRLAALGPMSESGQRLLEAAHRVLIGQSRQCLGAGLAEIRDDIVQWVAEPFGVVWLAQREAGDAVPD